MFSCYEHININCILKFMFYLAKQLNKSNLNRILWRYFVFCLAQLDALHGGISSLIVLVSVFYL